MTDMQAALSAAHPPTHPGHAWRPGAPSGPRAAFPSSRHAQLITKRASGGSAMPGPVAAAAADQQPPAAQEPARVQQLQAVDITPENFAPFGQVRGCASQERGRRNAGGQAPLGVVVTPGAAAACSRAAAAFSPLPPCPTHRAAPLHS